MIQPESFLLSVKIPQKAKLIFIHKDKHLLFSLGKLITANYRAIRKKKQEWLLPRSTEVCTTPAVGNVQTAKFSLSTWCSKRFV